MTESKTFPAIIVGASIALAALIFGLFYYFAQATAATNNVLLVTGSAKTQVTSDKAKLVMSISRIAPVSSLAAGYGGLARDLNLVNALLEEQGMAPNGKVESPIFMNQIYEQNSGNEIRYQLSQTISVQSDDVNKITEISKAVPSLASQGAVVSIQSLEYFYSKLPDLRVSLLTEAVKDAKARADKIAEGTGRGVGNIQSASSGVVQVLSSDSVEVSDYGSYDTTNIEKDVMVTVKASFRLK